MTNSVYQALLHAWLPPLFLSSASDQVEGTIT